jgi:hypothetical protein
MYGTTGVHIQVISSGICPVIWQQLLFDHDAAMQDVDRLGVVGVLWHVLFYALLLGYGVQQIDRQQEKQAVRQLR